jgi:hypothetical protein
MKYLITGETIETGRKVSPEEFAHLLDRGIVLTLEAYNRLKYREIIKLKGNNGDRMGVAIVEGDTTDDINRQLDNFPSWFKVNWTVTPLQ